MKCPTCGKGTDVIDSRIRGPVVRRRRQCLNEHRFATTEIVGAIDPRAIEAALSKLASTINPHAAGYLRLHAKRGTR